MPGAVGHACICRSCMELLVMHRTAGHAWNCSLLVMHKTEWSCMELLFMHGNAGHAWNCLSCMELLVMHGTDELLHGHAWNCTSLMVPF